MPLLLEGIRFGIRRSQNFQRAGRQFDALPFAWTFLQLAGDVNAGAGRDVLDAAVEPGNVRADDDLQVGQAATVVELDEGKPLLRIAAGPHPAGDFEHLPGLPGVKNGGDSCNVHEQ